MAIKRFIGTDGSYSTAGNWSPAGVPVAADTVRFTPDSGPITSGLNQSAVALTAFIVEEGCPTLFATLAGYLQINTARFEFGGQGTGYFDFGAAAVDPQILRTASSGIGRRGLYLIGTNMGKVNVLGGNVGIASNPGEVATVNTLRVAGDAADVWAGVGVTLTNFQQHSGKARVRCNGTTLDVFSGELTTEEAAALTTLNLYGGTVIHNATGTLGTANLRGGLLDLLKSDALRTITNLNLYRGAQLRHNKEAVTVTTCILQESAFLIASPP